MNHPALARCTSETPIAVVEGFLMTASHASPDVWWIYGPDAKGVGAVTRGPKPSAWLLDLDEQGKMPNGALASILALYRLHH